MNGNFEMFSAAGNRAVASMVATAKRKVAKSSRSVITDYLRERAKVIAIKHGEVRDTAVRECIATALDDEFKKAGYSLLSIFEI